MRMAGVYTGSPISSPAAVKGSASRCLHSPHRCSMLPSGHGIYDQTRARVFIFMRRDHQASKVWIVPAFAKVLWQVFRPLCIDRADSLFHIRALFQAFAQAQYALFIRNIDKSVVHIVLVLKNTLGAAADDHAVPARIGLFDDLLRDFYHLVCIEDCTLAKFQSCSQCRTAHGSAVN